MFTFFANLSICQNISIQSTSTVSKYFSDWDNYGQIKIISSFSDTTYGIFMLQLIDSSNVEALVTSDGKRMFESGIVIDTSIYVKVAPNDTLTFSSLEIEERSLLDSTYGEYYIQNLSLPSGHYELKVFLYDTTLTHIIDSAVQNITVEGFDMAYNKFPYDNSQLCFSKIDSVHFSFGNFDPNTFKELQITLIDTNNIIESDFEYAFLAAQNPIFTVSLDNFDLLNGFVFMEKFQHLPLIPDAYYAYTVKSYIDENREIPIKANNGFSIPFFFKLTSDEDFCELMKEEEKSFCEEIENGFEDGPVSLDRWVCKTGERTKRKDRGYVKMTRTGQNPNNHLIVQNSTDQFGLQTVHPNGGQYALKLGNTSSGAKAEQVSRTFTVTESNANFTINYAVVLDPAHPKKKEQGFFRIEITRSRLWGLFTKALKEEEHFADPSDSYLRPVGSQVVGDWRCYNVDLSNFIGQTVTLILTTADCEPGAHFAMAYIDFCFDLIPNFVLSLDDEYCEGTPILGVGSQSSNYTNFMYTIEECLDENGTRFGAKEVKSPRFRNSFIPSLNLTNMYNSAGLNFECGKFYRIKLAGGNDCNPWSETVKVIKIKCPTANAGADRCCMTFPCQFQIGSPSVPGYTYSWTPATNLSNSTIANPLCTIYEKPSTSLKYTVTVSDGECSATDDVEIFFELPIISGYTSSANYCFMDFTILAENYKSLTWTYSNGNGQTVIGDGKVIPNVSVSPTVDKLIYITATNPCGTVNYTITIPKNSSYYYHPLPRVGYPNVMQSNNPKRRLAFYEPWLEKDEAPAYHALAYKLEVWNMWGGKIYEKIDNSANFKNGEISWDGEIGSSGKYAHTGTYFYRLQLRNCATPGAENEDFTTRFNKSRWECLDSGTFFYPFCLCRIPFCKEQAWITYDCDGQGTGVPPEFSKPGCITDVMSDGCPCQWDVITIAD